MERSEALRKLADLIGKDLVQIGTASGITIWKGDRINKGWAGHTVERFLGLALNSSRAPNFGSWELKVVPVRALPGGGYKVKETMAITMIDPVEVVAKEFEDSHLFQKLCRMVVVARVYETAAETCSRCGLVADFDLGDRELFTQVRADYEAVRRVINEQGFQSLSGKMGVMVQPRTKGPGRGSTSRAFYARTSMVHRILKLPTK
jgi:DNA mismatch repair protein MutH